MQSKICRLVSIAERKRIAASPSVGGRRSRTRRIAWTAVLILLAATALAIAAGANRFVPRYQEFSDPDGRFANLNLGRPTDTTTNPFFQDMGTNGRSLRHVPSAQRRLFQLRRRISVNVSMLPRHGPNLPPRGRRELPDGRCFHTRGAARGHSLLLTRASSASVAVPLTADYQVVSVYNQYGCNATDVISMYRRPLPTTNLHS
jgi:hypothetical protein